MKKPLPGQIELVSHIAKIFGKRPVNPRQFNAIIAAANSILAEMEVGHIPAEPGCGVDAWLKSDECGASSKCLHLLLSGNLPARVDHPHDAGDFKRCVVMLNAIPKNRARLEEIRGNPEEKLPHPWGTLLAEWGSLEKLLKEEDPTLTEKIRELTRFEKNNTD